MGPIFSKDFNKIVQKGLYAYVSYSVPPVAKWDPRKTGIGGRSLRSHQEYIR